MSEARPLWAVPQAVALPALPSASGGSVCSHGGMNNLPLVVAVFPSSMLVPWRRASGRCGALWPVRLDSSSARGTCGRLVGVGGAAVIVEDARTWRPPANGPRGQCVDVPPPGCACRVSWRPALCRGCRHGWVGGTTCQASACGRPQRLFSPRVNHSSPRVVLIAVAPSARRGVGGRQALFRTLHLAVDATVW